MSWPTRHSQDGPQLVTSAENIGAGLLAAIEVHVTFLLLRNKATRFKTLTYDDGAKYFIDQTVRLYLTLTSNFFSLIELKNQKISHLRIDYIPLDQVTVSLTLVLCSKHNCQRCNVILSQIVTQVHTLAARRREKVAGLGRVM